MGQANVLFTKKMQLAKAIFKERMYYRGLLAKYFILLYSFIAALVVHFFYFNIPEKWPLDIEIYASFIILFISLLNYAALELVNRAYDRNKTAIKDINTFFSECGFDYVSNIWNPETKFWGHLLMALAIVITNLSACLGVLVLSKLGIGCATFWILVISEFAVLLRSFFIFFRILVK